MGRSQWARKDAIRSARTQNGRDREHGRSFFVRFPHHVGAISAVPSDTMPGARARIPSSKSCVGASKRLWAKRP
jgi:hypothetical protein